MTLLDITDETFEKEVIQESEKYVLVDFWAEWCGPCKQMLPVLKNLAVDMESTLKICKCDVDQNFEKAQTFNVASIPHLILFKNGEKIEDFIGFRNEDDMKSALEAAM